MMRDPPAQILARALLDCARDGGHIGGHMMLETVLADVSQQLLQTRNFHDARASERIQRVIRKLAMTHVAVNRPFHVIGGEPRETHRTGFHQTYARAERILPAYRPSDDFLEIHLRRLEE